ncbi:short-chain dehydrogenase/reductase family 9C member 7-like isoform X3 [Emydura macquarii macquarii]|uniref:short-chain dehydrogenase/reductase family 9C member 7-like isoform X3 n=1 Tax=Emydura macquarii macquarii TaxID=1129001 RepID=UPI00352B6278
MWEAAALLLLLLLLLPLSLVLLPRFRREAALQPAGRAVLITGCDSGFGQLLALRLHRLGFTVFAGCLCPGGEGARRLQREAATCSGRLRVLQLDVTRERDVAAAKEVVLSNLPETGRVVFMSSTTAYFTLGNGIYSMTKAALEKFCDCLRLEMKKFGVLVCVIQPGNYSRSTNIQPPVNAEQIWNELNEEEKAVYNKEYVKRFSDFFNNILKEGSTTAHEVVDVMVEALISPAPKARYMVAKLKEKLLVLICTIFPTVVMDSFLSYALSKVNLT